MNTEQLQEAFLTAMVEEQEFVEELEVINHEGFMDLVPHPFNNHDVTKLCDFFCGSIAEHHEITYDMLVIVLSDYHQSINQRLEEGI